MTQLDLFHATPIHRHRDPETSREGAEHVERKLTLMQTRMMDAFCRPSTANEAADRCFTWYGGSHETYRKRKRELQRLGLIVCVGKRKCGVTGRPAEVFEARKEQ